MALGLSGFVLSRLEGLTFRTELSLNEKLVVLKIVFLNLARDQSQVFLTVANSLLAVIRIAAVVKWEKNIFLEPNTHSSDFIIKTSFLF